MIRFTWLLRPSRRHPIMPIEQQAACGCSRETTHLFHIVCNMYAVFTSDFVIIAAAVYNARTVCLQPSDKPRQESTLCLSKSTKIRVYWYNYQPSILFLAPVLSTSLVLPRLIVGDKITEQNTYVRPFDLPLGLCQRHYLRS